MHTFISYFKLEFKRFLGIRNSIIVGLILVLSLGFIQIAIDDYRSLSVQKTEFQELEANKISQFMNYRIYGAYGTRMLFVPAPFSVFFSNTCVVPDMTAYIDNSERLNIYSPLIGKNVFGLKKFGFTDFSGILLFFGSLMALFYGYETFYHKEYLKTLASISRRLPLYFSLTISRILIISLIFLLIIGSALLLMLLNHLPVPINGNFLNFVFSILLVAVFFFSLGTAIGTLESRFVGIPALLSCWFLLLFILPALVNSYIENKSNMIKPLYKLEMEKLKIVMGFEKQALEKNLTFRYGEKLKEPLKELVTGYWNNEFQKLHALEKQMNRQMRENLTHFQWISVLFPTTHYISVVNEVSSRGYENLLDFYNYVQDLKARFVKTFMDKVFFSNYSRVEPFLKGDENVYYAKSRLPGTFLPGILLTIVYIIVFARVTYVRYKKTIYYVPAVGGDNRQHPDLKLSKGQYRIFSIESNVFLNRLYNLLSGQIDMNGLHGKKQKLPNLKIYIDHVDITIRENDEPFLFLCSPESIPRDMKVIDFFDFITYLTRYPSKDAAVLYEKLNLAAVRNKKIGQLKKQEKAELLLAITRMYKTGIYLIHDIARGMTRIFTVQFKDRMHELSEEGKLVLYLTSDTIISEKILEDNFGFIESTSNWIGMVESVRY
jgi:hypothetical protein